MLTTFRASTMYAYPHWLLSAWELYLSNPAADRFAIFQDDILAVQNLRSYLDATPYPDKSYLNLFTFLDNERVIRKQPAGWYEAATIRNKRNGQQRGCGALALAFSRDAMIALLDSGYMARRMQGPLEGYRGGRDKGGMPRAYSYIDGAVVTAMNKIGWREFIHAPSLIQHTGIKSTIGTGRMPLAKTFPGERFDARKLLPAQPKATPAPRPVCVVIPAAGDCLRLVDTCLAALARNAGIPIRVILVDNGCPPEVTAGTDRAALALGLEYQRIHNPKNLGFTRACNQGIVEANGTDVLLLNTDCRVGPNCIPLLLQAIARHPRVAAAGPLTFDNGGQSLANPKRLRQSGLPEIPAQPVDLDEITIRLAANTVSPELQLAFFCTILNRAALDELGHLDESPALASGLGADDLWCHKARRRGWEVLCHHGAFADHDHSATFDLLGLDRDAMQREAGQALRKVDR
ncbi:MAG: glycosyltransferase [Planctomycetes bacterium]|nr:glycosyltransferase [Planctomycetota bacterium]